MELVWDALSLKVVDEAATRFVAEKPFELGAVRSARGSHTDLDDTKKNGRGIRISMDRKSRVSVLAGLTHSMKHARQDQARELSDIPMLKAFCRVAPSVLFKLRAMLAARVFLLAAAFNIRTSVAVHARRFDFLAI